MASPMATAASVEAIQNTRFGARMWAKRRAFQSPNAASSKRTMEIQIRHLSISVNEEELFCRSHLTAF